MISKPRYAIHIYATADVKRKLSWLARKNRRSASAEVCAMIETAYKEQINAVQSDNPKPHLL